MNKLFIANISDSAAAHLTLISDANASKKRFAICSAEGGPVYQRPFVTHDSDGGQTSGDMSAAMKAVWLASRVKKSSEQLKLSHAEGQCQLAGLGKMR